MQQAALIERYTTFTDKKGKAVTRSETVRTSPPPPPIRPRQRTCSPSVAGTWAATEATHYIRDVDMKEDSSQARAPGAARFMATVGNATLNLLRHVRHQHRRRTPPPQRLRPPDPQANGPVNRLNNLAGTLGREGSEPCGAGEPRPVVRRKIQAG